MSILLIISVMLFLSIEFFIFTRDTKLGILSLASLIILITIEQILKKMGWELNILKSNKEDIKVIDESALIDGRIVDIVRCGFIGGSIVVPKYMVEKFKKLSNSENQLERFNARRALDIIAHLEENNRIPFKIMDVEVSSNIDEKKKIFEFAKKLKASVITSDLMMIKEGAIENVPILNINDLAFALKPVILPGDEMNIFIIKEGKEREQGVGYLEDGTMVVVEDGYNFIGKKVDVKVHSLLQTSNGKIIFARIKN